MKLLKNNKEYKNFNGLTPTQITRQWGQLYKSSKVGMNRKDVSIPELQYILKTTTNPKVYGEALETYNTLAKRSNRTSGTSYDIYSIYATSDRAIRKQAQTNRNRAKAEKLLEDIGYSTNLKKELYVKIGDEYIPNPKMVGVTFDKIKKEIETLGKLNGDSQIIIDIAIAKKQAEYDIFLKEVKKINKHKAEAVIKATNVRVSKFLFGGNIGGKIRKGYFGNLIGKDLEKQKLKELLKELNVGEKLALESLMTSNDFLKIWSSDQDDATYDEDFKEKRLDEVIKIIENHLGKGIEIHPVTGAVKFYDLKTKHTVRKGLSLESHLGK